MRDRIRPTRFMIARLGLFLAVVAWIVGQCWLIEVEMPTSGSTTEFGFGRSAAYVGINTESEVETLRGTCQKPEHSAENHWLADEWEGLFPRIEVNEMRKFLIAHAPVLKARRDAEEIVSTSACVVWGGENPGVRIHHWLVVTIFAFFNGVLMWLCRKRGKETAADE